MISRKFTAALVGISLATGALGTAAAQTTAGPATSPAAEKTTATKAVAAKGATHKAHHARTKMQAHGKTASLRTPGKVAAGRGVSHGTRNHG